MSVLRTVAASLVALAAGVAVTWTATDGLSAFTLESARREAVLADPVALPALPLRFADGSARYLADLPAQWLLVDFIYTRCASLCLAQGTADARVAELLSAEVARHRVAVVSISFDPARDDPPMLRAFLARDAVTAPGRMAAVPLDARDLARWLDAFGVVVVDDGEGGYVHNDAVGIVDPRQRLVALIDAGDPAAAVSALRARW
jgi:protein SCO1/2